MRHVMGCQRPDIGIQSSNSVYVLKSEFTSALLSWTSLSQEVINFMRDKVVFLHDSLQSSDDNHWKPLQCFTLNSSIYHAPECTHPSLWRGMAVQSGEANVLGLMLASPRSLLFDNHATFCPSTCIKITDNLLVISDARLCQQSWEE